MSIPSRKKSLIRQKIITVNHFPVPLESEREIPRPVFKVDLIYRLMEKVITDYLSKNIRNTRYIPERCLQLCQRMSVNIKDRIKELNYKQYRILCWLSIIEKRNQGIDYRMRSLIDGRKDNFIKYNFENAHFYIIAIVFLVHKE